MTARGRPNVNKAKPTPKAKPAKVKAKGAGGGGGSSLTDLAVSAAQKLLPGYTTKSQAKKYLSGKKHKSATALLKKAYDRRAKHQIRTGQLGQARKTLRKKRTVI